MDIQYNIASLQELLILDKDSNRKIHLTLQVILRSVQRIETCMKFKEFVQMCIDYDEVYVKLYCIFLYMCRDLAFFESICKRYNPYAKGKIRDKLDDIKLFILGDKVSNFDANYNTKITENESWKYHLGAYIQRIQTYILCM